MIGYFEFPEKEVYFRGGSEVTRVSGIQRLQE
jgi:hypothetical protein